MGDIQPLLLLAGSIAVLLLFILRLKIQAFLALLIVALGFGVVAGMDPIVAINSVQNGIGGTLGYVATVVGLGAMFGALLESSGGVQSLAHAMTSRSSPRGTQWSLTLLGFLVSIPIFLDVALIILAPLLFGLAKKTGRSAIYFGLPLLAGMMVSHTFIPPTPGPLAVADLLSADLAWVIMIGAVAGIPAMIIAGPLWTPIALRIIGEDRIGKSPSGVESVGASPADLEVNPVQGVREVAASGTVLAILLPLVLILVGSTAPFYTPEGSLRTTLEFAGHPFVALIASTLAVYYFFGIRNNMSKDVLLKIMTRALEPAGVVVVITGAGGAFKQILVDSGMGESLAAAVSSDSLPIIFFAFLVTLVIRIAQGSATVAMITGAGLTGPILQASAEAGAAYSQPQLALIVIAIASGASMLSHVNDSGFWLVSRYLEMTEAQALKAFTTMTSIVGAVGFIMVWLMWMLF